MSVSTLLRLCSGVLLALALAARTNALPDPAKKSDAWKTKSLASFELIWKTLADRYWDPAMGGLDWNAVHDQYRRQLAQAENATAARAVMERMVHLLPSSHLAIIPGSLYKVSPPAPSPAVSPKNSTGRAVPDNTDTDTDTEDETGLTGMTLGVIGGQVVVESVEPQSPAGKKAVHAGWTVKSIDGMSTELLFKNLAGEGVPKASLVARIAGSWLNGPPGSDVTVIFEAGEGKPVTRVLTREAERGDAVQFGSLPPEHVQVEHRLVENGVGYIRLNLFLDPVRVMPEIQAAVTEFKGAPGIVLDLRNNPGGIGIVAMGLAGWFIGNEGTRLGAMTSRDSTLNFVINPRPDPYTGRLAILVNEGSASTSEILAQGLKDLERAKIFGTRTAGAALPSNIIELPNGDRFQYPDANYVSADGRVLEGNGVEPDVVVAPTIAALSSGHDLPLEAATRWCREK